MERKSHLSICLGDTFRILTWLEAPIMGRRIGAVGWDGTWEGDPGGGAKWIEKPGLVLGSVGAIASQRGTGNCGQGAALQQNFSRRRAPWNSRIPARRSSHENPRSAFIGPPGITYRSGTELLQQSSQFSITHILSRSLSLRGAAALCAAGAAMAMAAVGLRSSFVPAAPRALSTPSPTLACAHLPPPSSLCPSRPIVSLHTTKEKEKDRDKERFVTASPRCSPCRPPLASGAWDLPHLSPPLVSAYPTVTLVALPCVGHWRHDSWKLACVVGSGRAWAGAATRSRSRMGRSYKSGWPAKGLPSRSWCWTESILEVGASWPRRACVRANACCLCRRGFSFLLIRWVDSSREAVVVTAISRIETILMARTCCINRGCFFCWWPVVNFSHGHRLWRVGSSLEAEKAGAWTAALTVRVSWCVLGQEWGCAEAGEIIKEVGLSEWPTLAIFLISEASRGTSSRWFPYFVTLPKTPSSILQWLVIEHPAPMHINPPSSRCLHTIFSWN